MQHQSKLLSLSLSLSLSRHIKISFRNEVYKRPVRACSTLWYGQVAKTIEQIIQNLLPLL